MKRRKKKIGRRIKITADPHSSWEALLDLEPKEFAVYVRRAEKMALPLSRKRGLALQQHNSCFHNMLRSLPLVILDMTDESMLVVSNHVLKLWQEGYYTPGPDYPFTFEETLQELREGAKAKRRLHSLYSGIHSNWERHSS